MRRRGLFLDFSFVIYSSSFPLFSSKSLTCRFKGALNERLRLFHSVQKSTFKSISHLLLRCHCAASWSFICRLELVDQVLQTPWRHRMADRSGHRLLIVSRSVAVHYSFDFSLDFKVKMNSRPCYNRRLSFRHILHLISHFAEAASAGLGLQLQRLLESWNQTTRLCHWILAETFKSIIDASRQAQWYANWGPATLRWPSNLLIGPLSDLLTRNLKLWSLCLFTLKLFRRFLNEMWRFFPKQKSRPDFWSYAAYVDLSNLVITVLLFFKES